MNNKKGFTLVELLIVIVIIGLLAGVVLAVINPQRSFRKAGEAAARSTHEKLCLGLFACASTTTLVAGCNSAALIGVTIPTQANTTATIAAVGNVVTITTSYSGYGSTCALTCSYDFGAGTPTNTTAGAGCL